MIVSASRRTDIPAFYSEWFFHRLKAGYVDAVNPFNRRQVSRISLHPADVEAFVFWTKNPAPFLNRWQALAAYKYYFQFTLTPYGEDMEPDVGEKGQVIHTFRRLAQYVGREKVVWRYDPILLNQEYTIAFHRHWFEVFCQALHDSTARCVISFLDMYPKIAGQMRRLAVRQITAADMMALAADISLIAAKYGITVQSCAEAIDLTPCGIEAGACIDAALLSRICGRNFAVVKDRNQRAGCNCLPSVDIGQYNTCLHLCRYCYANFSWSRVKSGFLAHDPKSSLLSGHLQGDETITWRQGGAAQ